MPKYIAQKYAAGVHNFAPGDEIELSTKDAKELLDDHAIVAAEPPPVADPPSESKPVAKKD